MTPYNEKQRATFQGRLLAFVRRKGQGEISVKIAMEGADEPVLLQIPAAGSGAVPEFEHLKALMEA